jgi:hypothetical protein
MQLTVMHPADRDDELVAHSASECARLCEGEVIGSEDVKHACNFTLGSRYVIVI